jgi:hypothetical protein
MSAEGDEDIVWESDGELQGVSDRGRRESKGVPKDPGKLDQPAASSQRYIPPAARRAASDSVQGDSHTCCCTILHHTTYCHTRHTPKYSSHLSLSKFMTGRSGSSKTITWGAQVIIAGDAGASERLIKRVKGLLNRLAEANVQPSIEEAAGLLESEGRRPAMSALTQELLQVCVSVLWQGLCGHEVPALALGQSTPCIRWPRSFSRASTVRANACLQSLVGVVLREGWSEELCV